MNIHIYTKKHTNQGFVALFFTVSIASILMAYVAISSSSVFDFMRTYHSFIEIRDSVQKDIICADGFINILVQSGSVYTYSVLNIYTYSFESYMCEVKNIYSVRLSSYIEKYFFISGGVYTNITIENGLISSSSMAYFSL